MISLSDYAKISDKVYEPSPASVESWSCPRGMAVDDSSVFSGGALFSSGLQGRVFLRTAGRLEAVIAFKGTNPAMVSDLTADLRLALGYMPRQAREAIRHATRWRDAVRKQSAQAVIHVTGHSLGGAIAQVVGSELMLPFVTFNAPGMRSQVLARIPAARVAASMNGVNFRGDGWLCPIAGLGQHAGEEEVLSGSPSSHGIAALAAWIEATPAQRDRVVHR